MKTTLPAKITTIEEAQDFLLELLENGEAYHPEDPAKDIEDGSGNRLFTDEEAEKLDGLMIDIYYLPENGNNARDNPNALVFDPCEYLMDEAKQIVLIGPFDRDEETN